MPFADQHQRQVRERREVAARADRSAARHARMHARVEQREQRSSVSRRMPEKPLASTFARSAIIARTARAGSGSPTPAAWLRSRLSCSSPSASRGIFDLGERAEAGVDAVDRRVAGGVAIDDGARRVDGARGRRRRARPARSRRRSRRS